MYKLFFCYVHIHKCQIVHALTSMSETLKQIEQLTHILIVEKYIT